MKNWQKVLKVDKKVKPLHSKDRQLVDLKVGHSYYVSFGAHEVTPCTLLKIEKRDGSTSSITIEIPTKTKSKRGFVDVDGNISHHWVDTHILYENEIGLTPEQAVINQVTS